MSTGNAYIEEEAHVGAPGHMWAQDGAGEASSWKVPENHNARRLGTDVLRETKGGQAADWSWRS